MSTYTVVEALALVTLWGAQRAVDRVCAIGARRCARGRVAPGRGERGASPGPQCGGPRPAIDSGAGPVVVLVHGQPGAGA